MIVRAAAAVIAAMALSAGLGCATSATEAHWGEALHQNTSKMIANPLAAQQNLGAPAALDGNTGEQVMENYRRNQVSQPERARTPSSLIERGIGAQ